MKYFISIVIIGILIIGGFSYIKKRNALPRNMPIDNLGITESVPKEDFPVDQINKENTAAANVIIVTYTEAGFEPATVTIKKGSTVRFENKSGRAAWVASALHPSHAVYPEKTGSDCLGSAFDACRSVPDGESWSFIFNSVGSWGYHDHLRASKFGKVIVE